MTATPARFRISAIAVLAMRVDLPLPDLPRM